MKSNDAVLMMILFKKQLTSLLVTLATLSKAQNTQVVALS